jgi:hypothetical protein
LGILLWCCVLFAPETRQHFVEEYVCYILRRNMQENICTKDGSRVIRKCRKLHEDIHRLGCYVMLLLWPSRESEQGARKWTRLDGLTLMSHLRHLRCVVEPWTFLTRNEYLSPADRKHRVLYHPVSRCVVVSLCWYVTGCSGQHSYHSLMKETLEISETLDLCSELTQLVALEDSVGLLFCSRC